MVWRGHGATYLQGQMGELKGNGVHLRPTSRAVNTSGEETNSKLRTLTNEPWGAKAPGGREIGIVWVTTQGGRATRTCGGRVQQRAPRLRLKRTHENLGKCHSSAVVQSSKRRRMKFEKNWGGGITARLANAEKSFGKAGTGVLTEESRKCRRRLKGGRIFRMNGATKQRSNDNVKIKTKKPDLTSG